MRDINELGPRPYRQSSLGPVREEEIQAFESHYSISLPTSFRKFLYALNGGRVRLRRYPDPVEGYGEINDFYGLGRKAADDEHALVNGWDIGNLWGEVRRLQQRLGNGVMPFARDAGDNQLFIDFRSPVPSVHRYVAETNTTYLVSPSYEEFIDSLQEVQRSPGAPVRQARLGGALTDDNPQ
ncbi:SMI1/KNR4 family protein [Humisphaera borealis]|uniref:SMI1/KNR4 family protein n=1 Tax=Humisphaera borealis TaxID=2807512 RepID=A0A7M2WQP4_9BACT|nr:SMI1/KNR4 family protein [Humisphaera borealis]QOV87743.1 SMI1/KNR4 family protein [Humisphaera borealis]